MREREEEEVHVSLADEPGPQRRLDCREMVAMGLDHALRRPSRPGRIDNGGDVVPAERLDATLDLGSNAGTASLTGTSPLVAA